MPEATIPAAEVAATTGTAAAPVAPAAPAAPERPDFLLSKFKTVEEQAKGYAELEKKLGAPKATTAPQIPTAPAEPELDDNAGISAIIERTGLKEDDIVKEWQTVKYRAPTPRELETGEAKDGDMIPYQSLSDEQYSAFKKIGIPKGAVKEYLTTQAALGKQIVEKALTDAYAVTGSKEQHENLLAWAGAGGIPKEDVDAMNAELAADPRSIVAITQRLFGIHTSAVGSGKSQPLIAGGIAAQSQGGFTSQAEMVTAMNDPRYKTDSAYRQSVQNRIGQMEDRTIHNR